MQKTTRAATKDFATMILDVEEKAGCWRKKRLPCVSDVRRQNRSSWSSRRMQLITVTNSNKNFKCTRALPK